MTDLKATLAHKPLPVDKPKFEDVVFDVHLQANPPFTWKTFSHVGICVLCLIQLMPCHLSDCEDAIRTYNGLPDILIKSVLIIVVICCHHGQILLVFSWQNIQPCRAPCALPLCMMENGLWGK